MTKEEVISIFKQKPHMLLMGANKIASQLKTDAEIVRLARAIVRKNMKEFGTTYNPKEVALKQPTPNSLKVLFLDVETAPMVGYWWSRWNQNLSLDQTVSEWYILTWSAKWGGDSEMHSGI